MAPLRSRGFSERRLRGALFRGVVRYARGPIAQEGAAGRSSGGSCRRAAEERNAVSRLRANLVGLVLGNRRAPSLYLYVRGTTNTWLFHRTRPRDCPYPLGIGRQCRKECGQMGGTF